MWLEIMYSIIQQVKNMLSHALTRECIGSAFSISSFATFSFKSLIFSTFSLQSMQLFVDIEAFSVLRCKTWHVKKKVWNNSYTLPYPDQTLRKMGSKRPTNTVQQLIEPIKYVERILTTALFWMLRAWFAYFNVFRVSLRFVLAGLTQASINTKHC